MLARYEWQCIADAAHVVEADYFGVVSGNRVATKFENSGLTASKAESVDAPVINEFPLCLECEFIEYQNGEYGCGVIGKVVNVTADESVMNGDKIDMSLVNATAFGEGNRLFTEFKELFPDKVKLRIRFSLDNLKLDNDVPNIPLFMADQADQLMGLVLERFSHSIAR